MLSLASIGTRVGFTFRFSALVPLNCVLVQNLIAVNPSGNPAVVTARLECIRTPQTVCWRGRPFLSLPANDLCKTPIAAVDGSDPFGSSTLHGCCRLQYTWNPWSGRYLAHLTAL